MKMKQLLEKIIKAESVLSRGDLLCEVSASSILRECIAALEADIAKPVEPAAYIEVFKHGGGESRWDRRLVFKKPVIKFPALHGFEPLFTHPAPVGAA